MKKRVVHIYLFRHGQTHFNKRKFFTGWKDSKWTSDGRKNAQVVARKLKSKEINVSFSSHLTRSKQTLREVLKFHPECGFIIQDDRMIERCYGALQGKSHAVFIKTHGKELFDKYHRAYDVPPPKGESVKMTQKRVQSFIKELIPFIKRFKVNVAISAHGNSMRPFRKHFENLSIKKMMALENPYDDFFEYEVEVPSGPRNSPKKSDWRAVHLPKHVYTATDKHNVLKTYY